MKNMLQNIAKYIIWALIFSVSSYVYAVGTWNEPSGNPPSGNTDAPINAGSVSQTKSGFLWTAGFGSTGGGYFATTLGVGISSTTNPTTLGLTGAFGGNVGAPQFCNQTGDVCLSIEEIKDGLEPDADDGLICPANPSISTLTDLNGVRLTIPYKTYIEDKANDFPYDDMYFDGTTFVYSKTRTQLGTQFNGGWNTANLTLPAACKTDEGCVIKQIIYRKREHPYGNSHWSEKIERVRYVDYNEDATSGSWTSSDHRKGGTNGNTTSTNIIKSYYTIVNNTTYQVILRDDRSGYDTAKGVVRPYDSWGSAGQEIYICTYGADTAI